MKLYQVKGEYLTAWTDTFTCIVNMDEIKRLSREWGVDMETLMAQVDEIEKDSDNWQD